LVRILGQGALELERHLVEMAGQACCGLSLDGLHGRYFGS